MTVTGKRTVTVGVLALQGGFAEHMVLLEQASSSIPSRQFSFLQVRTPLQLSQCDALVIPGGESTTMALVAADSGLLDPLRDFVKVQKKPTWGTCAGLILLSHTANATKKGGQELIGGLSVRVHRNHFGRQIESFETNLQLPFLDSDSDSSPPQNTQDREDHKETGKGGQPYPGVFIRAPVVEEVLSTDGKVQVLAKLPNRINRMQEGKSLADTKGDAGDIIAVREGNVFGTSFHPELTADARIHVWWLSEVVKATG